MTATMLRLPTEQWAIVNGLALCGTTGQRPNFYAQQPLTELFLAGLIEATRGAGDRPVTSRNEFASRYHRNTMIVRLSQAGADWVANNPENVALRTVSALETAVGKVRLDTAIEASGHGPDVFAALTGRRYVDITSTTTRALISADELHALTANSTPKVTAQLAVKVTTTGRRILAEA